MLGDVVEVVGVVEFDIDGPDSLGFGTAFANAAAATMIVPARQLVAKSLRIMSTLRSQVRALGVPLPVARMVKAFGSDDSQARLDITAVTVPKPEIEVVRDLVRDTVMSMETKAGQGLSSLTCFFSCGAAGIETGA